MHLQSHKLNRFRLLAIQIFIMYNYNIIVLISATLLFFPAPYNFYLFQMFFALLPSLSCISSALNLSYNFFLTVYINMLLHRCHTNKHHCCLYFYPKSHKKPICFQSPIHPVTVFNNYTFQFYTSMCISCIVAILITHLSVDCILKLHILIFSIFKHKNSHLVSF